MHRALLVALLVWGVGCGPASSGSISIAPGAAQGVRVINFGGPVTLTGVADATEVSVQWTSQDADGPANAAVDVEETGSAILVRTVPQAEGTWVDVVVSMPADLQFDVESREGDVTLDGLLAGGRVVTTLGFVTGAGLEGGVDVTVEEAEVDIETVLGADDGMTWDAASGPLTLRVPASTDALLSAQTGAGAVDILGVPFSGTNVGGTADGELGAGGSGVVDLSTGAGDILILATDGG